MPVPGAPIADWFHTLNHIRRRLIGICEEISDLAFKAHVLDYLPSDLKVAAEINKERSIKRFTKALVAKEKLTLLQNHPPATVSAFFSKSSQLSSKELNIG